jgi:Ni/Co efflux regulator RcnB
MKNAIAFLILTLTALVPAQSAAATKGQDATERVLQRVFSEAEKAVIEEYFGNKHDPKYKRDDKHKKDKRGLPPGLAKKDKLPPGLQMQLEKNGRLPPGLVRNDLPKRLQDKLYAPKKGTKRVIVGDDVVLFDTATDIVLDVLRGVARSQRY